jgi:hypothetical protein
MGKLFCWGGGRRGSCLSGRGRGGWGEGREGLIFTSYFYTRGEFSLCWVGGGAAFLPKDFHFNWHCVTEQRFHT